VDHDQPGRCRPVDQLLFQPGRLGAGNWLPAPTSGRILLDGRDAQELDMRTYRRFIAVVPQETVLFDGSMRDNVTYGHRQVSDTTVLQALRDANALEFVLALSERLDTLVGERGARLSGGQKQRLAIARALIRNPRVLILDEATSALDPVSEKEIREALERLMQGRTTLVVAHRLSTIRGADRIVVMANGRAGARYEDIRGYPVDRDLLDLILAARVQ
jgi:ATP-binding cassette subfamily B protein